MEIFTTDLVFVYGTLKRGYGNDVIFSDCEAEWLGPDVLPGEYFMTHAGCPFIFKKEQFELSSQEEMTFAPIRGEVWRVNSERQTETMKRLDRLEGEGTLYKRFVAETQGGHTVYAYRGLSMWGGHQEATFIEGTYSWP